MLIPLTVFIFKVYWPQVSIWQNNTGGKCDQVMKGGSSHIKS